MVDNGALKARPCAQKVEAEVRSVVRLEDIAEGMELAGLPGEEQACFVLRTTERRGGGVKLRYATASGEVRTKRVGPGDEEALKVVNLRGDWIFNPAYSDTRGLALSMDAMRWSSVARPRMVRLPLDGDFCAWCGPVLTRAAEAGMDFPLTISGMPLSALALPSPGYCAESPGTDMRPAGGPDDVEWWFSHDEASIMGAGIRGAFAGRGLDPRALVLDLTRAEWSVLLGGDTGTLRVSLPAAFWGSLGTLLAECRERDEAYFDLLIRIPTRRECQDSIRAVRWTTASPDEAASLPAWEEQASQVLFGALREHEGMVVQWVPRLSVSRGGEEPVKKAEAPKEPEAKAEPRISLKKEAREPEKEAEEAEKQPGAQEKLPPEPEKPPAPQGPVAEALSELNSLVGLRAAKKEVAALVRLQQLQQARREQGLPEIPMSNHLVFTGNPGTGKTTVARIVAKMYQGMGLVSKGQLVEVDRSGLVSGSARETVEKTRAVVQKALGGVLLVDEASSLAGSGGPEDYGPEAVGALLEAMEKHAKDLVVILAGRSAPMKAFVASSPGLRAQFTKYVTFGDHPVEDLMRIFRALCAASGYMASQDALSFLRRQLSSRFSERGASFAGVREVRSIFENAVRAQADRVFESGTPDVKELSTLKLQDVKRGWTDFAMGAL